MLLSSQECVAHVQTFQEAWARCPALESLRLPSYPVLEAVRLGIGELRGGVPVKALNNRLQGWITGLWVE